MEKKEKREKEFIEMLQEKLKKEEITFEHLKKRKTDNGFAINVNSLKDELQKKMNFDPSKLKEVKNFEDEKKYAEYFGIKSKQTFQQKKEILEKLEEERKIVVKSRTIFNNSFEKNVLIASVGTVIISLSKLLNDGVGAVVATLMELLTFSYLSQHIDNSYGHYTLDFFTEELGSAITFYFVDIEVSVQQVSWWIPYFKSEKDIVTVKILNIVGFSPTLTRSN